MYPKHSNQSVNTSFENFFSVFRSDSENGKFCRLCDKIPDDTKGCSLLNHFISVHWNSSEVMHCNDQILLGCKCGNGCKYLAYKRDVHYHCYICADIKVFKDDVSASIHFSVAHKISPCKIKIKSESLTYCQITSDVAMTPLMLQSCTKKHKSVFKRKSPDICEPIESSTKKLKPAEIVCLDVSDEEPDSNSQEIEERIQDIPDLLSPEESTLLDYYKSKQNAAGSNHPNKSNGTDASESEVDELNKNKSAINLCKAGLSKPKSLVHNDSIMTPGKIKLLNPKDRIIYQNGRQVTVGFITSKLSMLKEIKMIHKFFDKVHMYDRRLTKKPVVLLHKLDYSKLKHKDKIKVVEVKNTPKKSVLLLNDSKYDRRNIELEETNEARQEIIDLSDEDDSAIKSDSAESEEEDSATDPISVPIDEDKDFSPIQEKPSIFRLKPMSSLLDPNTNFVANSPSKKIPPKLIQTNPLPIKLQISKRHPLTANIVPRIDSLPNANGIASGTRSIRTITGSPETFSRSIRTISGGAETISRSPGTSFRSTSNVAQPILQTNKNRKSFGIRVDSHFLESVILEIFSMKCDHLTKKKPVRYFNHNSRPETIIATLCSSDMSSRVGLCFRFDEAAKCALPLYPLIRKVFSPVWHLLIFRKTGELTYFWYKGTYQQSIDLCKMNKG